MRRRENKKLAKEARQYLADFVENTRFDTTKGTPMPDSGYRMVDGGSGRHCQVGPLMATPGAGRYPTAAPYGNICKTLGLEAVDVTGLTNAKLGELYTLLAQNTDGEDEDVRRWRKAELINGVRLACKQYVTNTLT